MERKADFSQVRAHKLEGQHNYLEWRKYFDRSAKSLGVWTLLTGEEDAGMTEPTLEDNIVYVNTKVKNSTDVTIDSNRSLLQYQAAFEKWKDIKSRKSIARQLIDASLCDAIATEVEDLNNPRDICGYLKKQYAVSTDLMVVEMLTQAQSLKLWKCESMIDYINQHRELQSNLNRAHYDYPDAILMTNILSGLPKSYSDFIELWEWHKLQNLVTLPDIHTLTNRLMATEARKKVEQKSETRKGNNNNNRSGGQNSRNGTKKCTHSGCPNPDTHDTENCWTAHPEKKPQAVKNREAKKSTANGNDDDATGKNSKNQGGGGGRRITAFAFADVQHFRQLLSQSVEKIDDSDDTLENHADKEISNEAANNITVEEDAVDEEPITEVTDGKKVSHFEVPTKEDLRDKYRQTVHQLERAAVSQHPQLAFITKVLRFFAKKAIGRHLRIAEALHQRISKIQGCESLVETLKLLHNLLSGKHDLSDHSKWIVDIDGYTVSDGDPLVHIAMKLADVRHLDFEQEVCDLCQDVTKLPYHCECEYDLYDQHLDLDDPSQDYEMSTPPIPCSLHLTNSSKTTSEGPCQGERLGVKDCGTSGSGGCGKNVFDRVFACLGAAGAENVDRDSWIFDSGANMMVCNSRKWFTQWTPIQYTISTADFSNSLKIEGGGTCEVYVMNDDGKINTLEITEVAYAPNAHCNLMSTSHLGKKANLQGKWNKDWISIETPDGETLTLARENEGLYYVEAVVPSDDEENDADNAGFVGVINLQDEVWKWHRRLGHLGWQNMRDLLKMSTGCPLTDKQVQAALKTMCPICSLTKALVKIPREPARRRADQPGGLFHVDSWGPYHMPGYNGHRHFLFMVDDKTRYTWCEGYTRPADVPEVFKRMHKEIEKEYGITVRKWRMDGEFQKGEVSRYVKKHHMAVEPTIPYQHHMNGVGERGMRTVREKTKESLRSTSMPENLWPCAMEQAVWYKNRSPSRALKNKMTPWEAFHGYKPNLSREHIFGSRMFVTLPPEKGRDALPKLHESVYKVYSEEKHRVFRVSMARVDEGVGLDDEHDLPPMAKPDPPPENEEVVTDDETDECLSESSENLSPDDEDEEMIPETPEPMPNDDFWGDADDESDEYRPEADDDDSGMDSDDDDDGPPDAVSVSQQRLANFGDENERFMNQVSKYFYAPDKTRTDKQDQGENSENEGDEDATDASARTNDAISAPCWV
ncbi:gag-polypeptide of LTR copia-type domain-containing protein [Trichoderma breve]|uniref:Gag-polypeptide of LTR copia-type domain-containing protein n=1 Tax=Trichoderma breve TaxID=2034170 RepID=A0A9W9EEE4_9HYPO|nr:gag-polypeptide of LTR copia-type domain-containing protein [Trichoderma breve]KAJ4865180.1 gag-polypeptide of LTR copia-type domain-containing protein [Trichoderma breve]